MREPSKAQIITIEKIATILRDFNNYRYPEILGLLNQYNLSKDKKILVSIHADLKNKNESEYAEEFAKKYNL